MAPGSIDTRIANVTHLPPGPFQLSPGLPYDAYANSPVHRYYQMYQQADCSATHATVENSSGCLNDLFPWVEVTIGAGSNGKPQPQPFTDMTTGEGSTAMGFFNVQHGDMPYFKQLADQYSISDNYHQPAMGGTGLDSIIAGFGDAIWYADASGNPSTPPANQIENPDPESETNNYCISAHRSSRSRTAGLLTVETSPPASVSTGSRTRSASIAATPS